MTPPLFALLALLPFAAFPLLAAAALGAPIPRLKPTRRTLLIVALAILASLHAYVSAEEKGDPVNPPNPPEPPPGPYVPGGVWETKLHRNPFNGSLEWKREYKLLPSAPEIPTIADPQ